jgi:hypothetical protein
MRRYYPVFRGISLSSTVIYMLKNCSFGMESAYFVLSASIKYGIRYAYLLLEVFLTPKIQFYTHSI